MTDGDGISWNEAGMYNAYLQLEKGDLAENLDVNRAGKPGIPDGVTIITADQGIIDSEALRGCDFSPGDYEKNPDGSFATNPDGTIKRKEPRKGRINREFLD